MYVVQVSYHELAVVGVFTNYDDAKKLADSILKDRGEYAVVYDIELNVADLRDCQHKVIYDTEMNK